MSTPPVIGNEPVLVPYSPARTRERVRSAVAISAVLAAVLAAFVLLVAVIAGWMTSKDATDLAAVVMAPLFGLAGAATAFYLSGSDTTI